MIEYPKNDRCGWCQGRLSINEPTIEEVKVMLNLSGERFVSSGVDENGVYNVFQYPGYYSSGVMAVWDTRPLDNGVWHPPYKVKEYPKVYVCENKECSQFGMRIVN